MKKLLYSISAFLFIITLTYLIVSYGKGYRFDLQKKSFTPTGILSLSSSPDGASVWINDKLTTATNASISLQPGWYTIRIGKSGYIPWEKSMRVQGEVVSRAEALLIRSNPSLRALSDTGVFLPSLSPSEGKIAYIVTDEQASLSAGLKPKSGVWIFDLRSGPLGGMSDPKQIYTTTAKTDWKNTQLIWSPDEKTILLLKKSVVKNKEVLLSALQLNTNPDSPNTTALDVSATTTKIQDEWNFQKKTLEKNLLASIATPAATFFNSSTASLLFSPNESKILYEATASSTIPPVITPALIGSNPTDENRTIVPKNYYVYDIKEDKNYIISSLEDLPSVEKMIWYTDSKHIILIGKDSLSIIDYDGTNKRTAYSGPFTDSFVFPSPNGGKIIILTSLNRPEYLPNLYEVDLQ